MNHHADHNIEEGRRYDNISDEKKRMMEEYSENAASNERSNKTKNYWIISSINTVILVAVFLALYVIFPKAAQSLINKSNLDVTAAGITFAKPDALTNDVYSKFDGGDMDPICYMTMESDLSNAGPFSAKLKFHNPVHIYYKESYLGDMYLDDETHISSGKGKLNSVAPFLIHDETAFAEFSKTALTSEKFKWTLKGKLDITKLSRTTTVDFDKEIELNGMNGLSEGFKNFHLIAGLGAPTTHSASLKPRTISTDDDSILALIPIVGKPLVQKIVDGSVLSFDNIIMSDVTEKTFKVQMKGAIKEAGPIFATISFVGPLTVAWQGKTLGTVTMNEIKTKPLVGGTFDSPGVFTISSAANMAEFAAYMINNPSFNWDISSSTVTVEALGLTFTKISIKKSITLAGSNGFRKSVSVKGFNLPSSAPNKGIALTVNTVITNPSQVGFSLAGVEFENFFGNVDLGPLQSVGAAFFKPQSTVNIPLTGYLSPQTSAEGITAITTVFGHYLSGASSTLTVKGVSGSGPSGKVSWLSTAFKTLVIENVVLPGPKEVPTLIPSIEMKNMQLDFTKDPWAPLTSSTQVEAKLANPFGFPLSVQKINMNVEATYGGNSVASLKVPDNAATTSSAGLITTSFKDVPFTVANKELFSGFLQKLTVGSGLTFGLKGVSNAVATTDAGTLSLPGIQFNVDTNLAGFAGFNNKATILSLKITGASASYVIVELTVQLENPSAITITIGDINFDVIMPAFNNARVGVVYMKNVVIPPGAKTYTATMNLAEKATSAEAVGSMLTSYMAGITVPLVIQGTAASTSIVPLAPALSSLQLKTDVPGTSIKLVKEVAITGDFMKVATEFIADGTITIHNPLETSITLLSMSAVSSRYLVCDFTVPDWIGEQVIGTIDNHVFNPPLVIQAGETVQTGPITVHLPEDPLKGIQSLLGANAEGQRFINITQHASVIVGDNFHVTDMYYFQNEVSFAPTIPGITDDEALMSLCMGDSVAFDISSVPTIANVLSSNA